MTKPRTFKRVVMARRGSRSEAETIAEQLLERNPNGEYAVEYTSVALQPEQWRVIYITDVPLDTPDVNPHCLELRKGYRGQLSENDYYW